MCDCAMVGENERRGDNAYCCVEEVCLLLLTDSVSITIDYVCSCPLSFIVF